MRRTAAFLIGIFLLAAPVAQAACVGIHVPSLVGGVPYFVDRMTPSAQSVPEGTVALSHRDDARIRVTIRAESVDPIPPMRRSEFIQSLRQATRGDNRGAEPIVGIVPYDPMSWSVQTRSRNGDALVSDGSLTIRQSPTCQVVASWSVVETPVLVGRVKEFASALDVLRSHVARISLPIEFMPEANVPTGNNAILFGLLLPLGAAGLLFYSLRHMLNLSDPGLSARAVAGIGAVVAATTVAFQAPEYLEGLPDFRFTDVAGLLLASGLLLAAMSATANGKVTLAAFSVTLCAGLAVGVGAAMGWTPAPHMGLLVAATLFACALVGLWLWNGQAYKRVPRIAKEGRPA